MLITILGGKIVNVCAYKVQWLLSRLHKTSSSSSKIHLWHGQQIPIWRPNLLDNASAIFHSDQPTAGNCWVLQQHVTLSSCWHHSFLGLLLRVSFICNHGSQLVCPPEWYPGTKMLVISTLYKKNWRQAVEHAQRNTKNFTLLVYFKHWNGTCTHCRLCQHDVKFLCKALPSLLKSWCDTAAHASQAKEKLFNQFNIIYVIVFQFLYYRYYSFNQLKSNVTPCMHTHPAAANTYAMCEKWKLLCRHKNADYFSHTCSDCKEV